MSFPAMLAWSLQSSPSAGGRAIGGIYAVNTLGAIVGSFAGGFLLIPALGMQRTLLMLVAVTTLCAVAFALLGAPGARSPVSSPGCSYSRSPRLASPRPGTCAR